MKRAVFATAIWAGTTGFALAKITLSGEGRIGFSSGTLPSDATFIGRGQINFAFSGTTDNGLTYGGFISSADINELRSDGPGSLYIAGDIGRLSVGNVDGAATAAIGQVRGVGLVSANDQNDISYLANGGGGFRTGRFGNTSDPSARLQVEMQGLTLYASVTQPERHGQNAYAIAARRLQGKFAYAVGYELERTPIARIDHVVFGATATLGQITAKAIYGKVHASPAGFDASQWAISAAYTVNDLTMIAYYTDDEDLGTGSSNAVAYGLGMTYLLDNGLSFVGGVSHNQTRDSTGVDLGLYLSF